MGNRTSTCLMYDSSHDKIMVLLNFAFKCSLVNETSTTALVQAGTQANQLASATDHTGKHSKFHQKSHKQRFLFFLKTQRRHFCVCHKKGVSGKHPIHENNTYYVCFH